jgi:hypothetical protein
MLAALGIGDWHIPVKAYQQQVFDERIRLL